MLEDLRALVEFAHAGRLCRTADILPQRQAEYWSEENQFTNSSASFTRVPFALTAGADGTRES